MLFLTGRNSAIRLLHPSGVSLSLLAYRATNIMRAAAVISFIGAAAPVLASVQSGQLHEPVAVAVAVAVRHVDGAVCDVEATSNIDGQATPEPVVISDSEPKAKSWTEINTTVTVGAGSWSANTTSESWIHKAVI